MTPVSHNLPDSALSITDNATFQLIDVSNSSDEHVHRFEPNLPQTHVLMMKVLTALLTALGLGFNSLALISILKFFYHFSVSCRFVINLLLTDLLFSAVVLCRFVLSLLPEMAPSRALCLGYFSGMLCTGSTVQLSLLLALLDNFVTIVFPLRHRTIITCRAAHIAIAVVWVYGVGVMVVLPNLDVFNDWRSSLACDFNQVIAKSFRTLLAAQFGVVTSVLVGLYVRVLRVALRHQRVMMQQGEHLSEEERDRIRDRCSAATCSARVSWCSVSSSAGCLFVWCRPWTGSSRP